MKTPRAAAIAGILFAVLLITGLVLFRLSVRANPLFGSGLLFLAMLFASAAVAGGIIIAYGARPEGLLDCPTFTFARAVTYEKS